MLNKYYNPIRLSELSAKLYKHSLEQKSDRHESTLLIWRKRIFTTIFLCIILTGSFTYISNVQYTIQSGQWLNATVYTLAYLVVLIIVIVRALPFKFRVWTGLLIFYGVGITSLLALGPVGSGRMFLFAFALLASLLLGLRAGILALVLNIITFSLLGWLFSIGQLQWPHLTNYASEKWATTGYTFFFFNTVVTVSIGVLVGALEKNLQKEQSLTRDLQLTNAQLERENAERRLAQESLRNSEERYKTLTNNLHVGIYRNTAGPTGKFLEANPALLDMFGFRNRDEIFNVSVSDLYQNPEDRKIFCEKMSQKGFVSSEELKLITRDGKPIICAVSAVAVKDEKGEVKYYDGVIEDVTERKQLESQFQQAQKLEAIGTLAGGIAHDFNNLLMVIQGNISLMCCDLDVSHPLYQNLENIEQQIIRGADLTKKLLGYARKGKYNTQLNDLNQIVKETSDTFGRTRKEIIIHQKFASDLLPIEADRGQIEQVLFNLFINAADAMPQGGDLTLRTKNVSHANMQGKLYRINPGRYVQLRVTDTGVGMDKKVQERIFEPFFTTKDMGKGTGLGLASVYGIIKGHGGYIDVESKLGSGTTFSIYLPASDKKILKTKDQPIRIENGSGKILLVDDEKLVLEVGSKLLTKLGYTVFEANDGKTAVEIFKENHKNIDLAILDMIMPGMGGSEVFDKIKEINSDIKVLLSSGYSVDSQASEILLRGCDDFIQKPFGLENLSNKLKAILTKN